MLSGKEFEMSNHLGNCHGCWVLSNKTLTSHHPERSVSETSGVLAVVTDRKVPIRSGSTNYCAFYLPNVTSYSDYYPFGMQMPQRNDASSTARYGFNSMERDDELKGEGNSYDFGARMYDSRLGRWFKMDTYSHFYANCSPYSFALNNPVIFSDEGGDLPKIEIWMDDDGVVQIRITNEIYLVAKDCKNIEAILNIVANTDFFYQGGSVNTNLDLGRWGDRQINITITNDIVGIYDDIKDAIKARASRPFGVIAEYKDVEGDKKGGSYYEWTPENGGRFSFGRKSEKFPGEFAHELAHDWGGFSDLYVLVKRFEDGSYFDGTNKTSGKPRKGLLVDSEGNIVRDLMNDGYSPLQRSRFDQIAEAIILRTLEIHDNFDEVFYGAVFDINAQHEYRMKLGDREAFVLASRGFASTASKQGIYPYTPESRGKLFRGPRSKDNKIKNQAEERKSTKRKRKKSASRI